MKGDLHCAMASVHVPFYKMPTLPPILCKAFPKEYSLYLAILPWDTQPTGCSLSPTQKYHRKGMGSCYRVPALHPGVYPDQTLSTKPCGNCDPAGHSHEGHDHSHKHDDSVASVSVLLDGDMDLEKVFQPSTLDP